MKILLTGGAGFIGSNLVRLLLSRGHEVLNVDNLTYAGNLSSLTDIEHLRGYRHARLDICDAAGLREIFADYQPEAVVHLAAESHVDRSVDQPHTFVQTNVVGTCTLLEAARRAWSGGKQKGRRLFLHVSTDEVFGSLLGPTGKFTEATPYRPHSPYAASKAASDHLARAWHDTYGLPVVVTNCSNNYGPCQFPEKLVPTVILKALRGEPVPVYGKGENIRDWLYVGDHAEALLAVLERAPAGSTYNIGGDNEWRNIDLVTLLCRILDDLRPLPAGRSHTAQISFVQDRPGHDFRYAMDAGRIRRQLGWKPKQDAESGFRKTVRWYLDHESWWQEILTGAYRMERLGTL